jgi:hypothetical protein
VEWYIVGILDLDPYLNLYGFSEYLESGHDNFRIISSSSLVIIFLISLGYKTSAVDTLSLYELLAMVSI